MAPSPEPRPRRLGPAIYTSSEPWSTAPRRTAFSWFSSAMNDRLLLRLEGLTVAVIAGIGYALMGASWWLFAALLLLPDVFMIGYLWGPLLGASIYNTGHTYALPLVLGAGSFWLDEFFLGAVALIWVVHIGLDRALGFGLKQSNGFQYTHLSPS